MKLKDLMASTLPRSRKSKRKSEAAETKENGTVNNKNTAKNRTKSKDKTEDKVTGESKKRNSRGAFSINFNFNLRRDKSNKDKSSVRPEVTRQSFCSQDFRASQTTLTESPAETTYNTIPKARSRIRTNPWLPSPKTSPYLSTSPGMPMTSLASSMTSSMTSSVIVQGTPSTPESGFMDTSFSGLSDYCSLDGYVMTPAVERTSCYSRDISANSLSDVDSLLQQSCQTKMVDYCAHCPDCHAGGANDYSLESTRNGDLPTPTSATVNNQSAMQVSTVSFDYEQELESRLEHNSDYNTFREQISSDPDTDGRELARTESHLDEDAVFLDDNQPLFSDDSEDSGSTLCDDLTDPVADTDNWFRVRSYSSSRIHSDAEKISPSGRSVHDIQTSLQEKVLKLREEKRIVDEKIRQAREEERVRAREMERFRQQTVLMRKKVLLDTLTELGEKMRGQSERLQVCYDQVLRQQHAQAVTRSRQSSTSNLADDTRHNDGVSHVTTKSVPSSPLKHNSI